jgi:very-short-patch-repair endonuclease
MPENIDQSISCFASEHHGVFGLDLLTELGVTARTRQRRLESGRWVRLYDEVYAVGGCPPSWRRELMAACLAGGSGAVASHRSAARLWELPGGVEDPAEITCRRWKRTQEHGVLAHESKALEPVWTRIVDGIPTASPELTLIQLGAVYRTGLVEMAYDTACRLGLVTETSTRRALAAMGARGRNGIGVLRAIVDDRSSLSGVPESPMESRALRALRRHGLPAPVSQHEVWHEGRFVARVDFAYVAQRIAIECDSYTHHVGRSALDRDTERRRRLQRAGWEVVGLTNADLQRDCVDVVQTLQNLFRRHVATSTVVQ